MSWKRCTITSILTVKDNLKILIRIHILCIESRGLQWFWLTFKSHSIATRNLSERLWYAVKMAKHIGSLVILVSLGLLVYFKFLPLPVRFLITSGWLSWLLDTKHLSIVLHHVINGIPKSINNRLLSAILEFTSTWTRPRRLGSPRLFCHNCTAFVSSCRQL